MRRAPLRRGRVAAALTTAVALVGLVTAGGPAAGLVPPAPPQANAVLADVTGAATGVVAFVQDGPRVHVRVRATGLTPGWHGFHVHAIGNCAVGAGPADPFSAAGGHLGSAAGQTHAAHDGDMPLLFANGDGAARASFLTDNFTVAQILDAAGDGSAVVIHQNPDNYSNIPADPARYRRPPFDGTTTGPDAVTLAGGDSGSRQRCGVVQPGPVAPAAGYWLVARDGGVFAFGDSRFFGSTGAIKLNKAMVGMASTQSGEGYWLAAADGGVFAFGDATFHGSTGNIRLNQPMVGMAAARGEVSAVLRDATGAPVGAVNFSQEPGKVRVEVSGTGLTPGWHGFHVHAIGNCAVGSGPTDPFSAAGGHLGSTAGQVHGVHDGDLPLLYAGADGVARAVFRTDNFTVAQLLDADGSAAVVHANPDNYANIPADPARYRRPPFDGTTTGPDAVTLAAGDSGARQRCGVVQRTGKGYWLVANDGGVFAFGDAKFFGSTGAIKLNQQITGLSPTPSGQGYWLVAQDGGVFAFGDARFFGSTGSIRLNEPIADIAPTPSGQGYWLVARDGGVFAFGDAVFRGSTGDIRLNKPIVSMMATPSGLGYWLIASDGGVFAFGDAPFKGSTGSISLNEPIKSGARHPGG